MNIHPFYFRDLPVVTREEINFFKDWASLSPAEIFPPDLPTQLFAQIESFIHGSISWEWTKSFQFQNFAQITQRSTPPLFLLQVSLRPLESSILIECPLLLSRMMLDRALGGNGENVEEGTPLSDIEKGIVTFLLLKLTEAMSQSWAEKLNIELRLEGIHHSMAPLLDSISRDKTFYRREMQLNFLGKTGFIRLYTPLEITQEFVKNFGDLRNTPKEYSFFDKQIHRVIDVPLSGYVQVGSTDLSEADLYSLQPDDIILMNDDCLVSRREEDRLWEGQGILKFSEQAQFALRCKLQNSTAEPFAKVCIEEIIELGEPPMTGQMNRSEYLMDEQQAAANEYEQGPNNNQQQNIGEMGPVLSDVPVPLIVELGRITCSARELMYMKIGDILELNRSPHEPLNLVVNGRSVGRGEVVEVEGKLGIRIISLQR